MFDLRRKEHPASHFGQSWQQLYYQSSIRHFRSRLGWKNFPDRKFRHPRSKGVRRLREAFRTEYGYPLFPDNGHNEQPMESP